MSNIKRRVIWVLLALVLMGLIVIGAVSLRESAYWTRISGTETEEYSFTEDEESTEAAVMQWLT